MSHFRQGGISGIVEGIKTLGSAIKQLPGDLQTCENVEADVTKIEQWAAIFDHPAELEKVISENFIERHNQVFGDFYAAMNAWHAGQYYQFGEKIGMMTVVATTADSSIEQL
jgi:Mlc titration factor MtfA (ptsG expression regulator)